MRALQRSDPSVLFDSATRSDGLVGRSARGGAATLAGQASRTIVQLIGTVLLARLLTPDEFGLISMAAVVVGFAQMIKDAGLASATIQQPQINNRQVSTLFWMNLAVSLTLAVLVIVLSPALAAFYGRPELGPITAALSAAFLVSGLASQHEALLRRQMLFAPIAVAQVAAQVANVLVSVAAALVGLGYWSIVVGTSASALVNTLAVLYFCPWVPQRPSRGVGAGKMLKFGMNVFGFNVVNFFARNGDYVLIGKFVGAAPLGVYTRAYQLFMQPVSQVVGPLSAAAMPALSALCDDRERYASYYRRFVGLVASLTVPMAVYLGLEAEFVVRVVLGSQWVEAAPVLRWLSPAAVFQAVTSTLGLVLVSSGRSERYLQMGVSNAVVMLLGIAAGLRWGILGVAIGYSAANVVYWVPATWVFTRGSAVRARTFWLSLAGPVLHSAAAAAALLATLLMLDDGEWLAHLFALVVFAGTYAMCVLGRRSFRQDLRMVLSALKGNSDD